MPNRGHYGQLLGETLDYEGIKSRSCPEGKTYRVPMPDIPTGMKLTSLGEVASVSNAGISVPDEDLERLGLDDLDDGDIERMTLGSVYDEMIADGVHWDGFRYVFADAFAFLAVSPELADILRQRLGEAIAPPATDGAPSTSPTLPSTDGSSSSAASTDTADQTQTPASGQ